MPRMDRIGTHRTTVVTQNNVLRVTYHNTAVVTWYRSQNAVTLDSGGWQTVTTKTRMNQTSWQFGLGYQVFQKDYVWYVETKDGTTIEFKDGMTIDV